MKIQPFVLAVLFALTVVSCSRVPSGEAPGRTVEQRPAVTRFQRVDKVKGYNDNVFYIVRPAPKRLRTVSSSTFGLRPDAADNTAALRAALDYCREHPDTRLLIGEGTYHFTQSSPIEISGLRNVFIDGRKAEFITGVTGSFFRIADCDGLEIHGLTFDWERKTDPIDDVARVRKVDPAEKTLELVFFEKDVVDPSMRFAALTQCDPVSLTFGAKGPSKECYLIMFGNQNGIKECVQTAPNVLRIRHSGCLSSFAEGETFLVRHYIYDGNVFSLGGESRNVTFSSVKFYGSPGMAIVAGGSCSHFQVLDCTVDVDPALRDFHHVSLGSDAFHFLNTCGCFRVAGNDVCRQGDDALNVHDGLGYIAAVEDSVVCAFSGGMRMVPGDTLRFKDEGYFDTDGQAVIVAVDNSVRPIRITLDRDVSSFVRPGFTAWNTGVNSGNYVVENNYFHENRARGLLLQSSEGLCRHNRFYKIQGMAIRVVMDIVPTLWQEGTGVDGLEISDNSMESCDYSAWGCQIEISTNIDGRSAGAEVFRNIRILRNTFTDFSGPLLRASNVHGLTLQDNTVEGYAGDGPLYVWGEHCSDVMLDGAAPGN